MIWKSGCSESISFQVQAIFYVVGIKNLFWVLHQYKYSIYKKLLVYTDPNCSATYLFRGSGSLFTPDSDSLPKINDIKVSA